MHAIDLLMHYYITIAVYLGSTTACIDACWPTFMELGISVERYLYHEMRTIRIQSNIDKYQ